MAAAWVSSVSYTISTLVLIFAFLRKSDTQFKELLPGSTDLQALQKSIKDVRNKRNN